MCQHSSLGISMRAYRRSHGLKQSVLAEYLGTDQATISRWEKGITEPSLSMQKRIKNMIYPKNTTGVRRISAVQEMDIAPSMISLCTKDDIILHRPNRAYTRSTDYSHVLPFVGSSTLRIFQAERVIAARAWIKTITAGSAVAIEAWRRCISPIVEIPDDTYQHSVSQVFYDGDLPFIVGRDIRVSGDDFRAGGYEIGSKHITMDDI